MTDLPTDPPRFHHHDEGTAEQRWAAAREWADLPRRVLPERRHRLVVLVPHPDDESLAAGGLVSVAARRGWSVDVVVATDGAASHPDSPTHPPARLREVREAEVRAAVGRLAPGAVVHLLRLPDGELAAHQRGTVEAVVDLVGDGADVLLVSTWAEDGHPDHAAAAEVAAVVAWRTDALLWQAPIWAWMWSSPERFPWQGAHRLELDPPAREAKRRALAEHRSQHLPLSEQPGDEALLSGSFLRHFDRPDELFWAVEPDRRSPFDDVHRERTDPWQTHSSWYEERKRAVTLASLTAPRYRRALEIGCSVGVLSRELAGRCEELVAADESEVALAAAADLLGERSGLRLLRADLPEEWPAGELDLVVLSETGYYLSPARFTELLRRVAGCTVAGAVLLSCHWRHEIHGWPLDGDAVRVRIEHQLGWEQRVHHVESDFELVVWQRPSTGG